MNTNNYLKVRQGKRASEFFFDRYNDLSKASARRAAENLAKALREANPKIPVEISIFRHVRDGFAFVSCIGGPLVGCPKCSEGRHLRLVQSANNAP